MYSDVMEEGVLYQTIVTTGFHRPNAAAMGVRRRGGDLAMLVFEGSDTFENLGRDRRLAVHLVPREREGLVVRAALTGWGTGRPEFPAGHFDSYGGIPYLASMESRVFCRLESWDIVEVEDDVGRSRAMDVVAEVFKDETWEMEPIRHRESPLVEAASWATRWKACEGENSAALRNKALRYLRKARDKSAARDVKMVEDFLGYRKRE